jgi:hypothetical protein
VFTEANWQWKIHPSLEIDGFAEDYVVKGVKDNCEVDLRIRESLGQ